MLHENVEPFPVDLFDDVLGPLEEIDISTSWIAFFSKYIGPLRLCIRSEMYVLYVSPFCIFFCLDV